MPSRSNDFQRLVFLIEAALNTSAATVQESLLLRDLIDGTLREVDIAIEVPSGPRTLRIAVECRDHQRPATIQWINELTGKYVHLPVDRVVAVSRSGFTRSVKKKAEAVKIDLVTFEDIDNFDWTAVPNLPPLVEMQSTRYNFVQVTVHPAFFLVITGDDDLGAMALQIYRQGGPVISLADKLHWDVCRKETVMFLKETWTRDPMFDVVMRFDFTGRGWFARDSIGTEHELEHVDTVIKGGIDIFRLTMRPAAYANTTIAYGESVIDDELVSVAVVLPDGEQPRWRWYLKSGKVFPWRSVRCDAEPQSVNHIGDFYAL